MPKLSMATVHDAGLVPSARPLPSPRMKLLSGVQPFELVLFVILFAVFIGLVVPPIASLVVTAFTNPTTEEFTLGNFANILPTLVRADLLSNTLVFAVSATVISFAYGSLLAWFAERTNAPFRRLVYVSAFLSFALPMVIQVLGWVFLLGRKQGLINSVLVNQLGILSEPLDVQSMGGMIFVESVLWSAVVFLLMAVPFRSMDATLEEAGRVARGSGPEIFFRITLRLAMPAGLAVVLISVVRNLEAFEVPAILGLPGGVNVLTTQIFVRLHATVLPNYGQVSAYSVLLVLLVLPLLYAYHRATKGQGRYATITGKGLRTTRLDLGRIPLGRRDFHADPARAHSDADPHACMGIFVTVLPIAISKRSRIRVDEQLLRAHCAGIAGIRVAALYRYCRRRKRDSHRVANRGGMLADRPDPSTRTLRA